MIALRQALTLAGKDLRIVARAGTSLWLAGLVGVLVVVVMAMATGSQGATDAGAPSRAVMMVWISILIASVLSFELTASKDREEGAQEGLRLLPVTPGTLYLGKLTANLVVCLLVSVPVMCVGGVLLNTRLGGGAASVVPIVMLSVLGLAAIGTLMAGNVTSTGGTPAVALVMVPLALPLILTSCRLLERALADGGVESARIGVLLAMDVVYLVIGFWAFEKVLEE